MTKTELLKMIEAEVTRVATEPIREPEIKLPEVSAPKQMFNPALKDEGEIDEFLFRAGMKD